MGRAINYSPGQYLGEWTVEWFIIFKLLNHSPELKIDWYEWRAITALKHAVLNVLWSHLRNETMENQINHKCHCAFLQIRKLSFLQIRKYLDLKTTGKFVHAFVTSRLDMNNSLFYFLPSNCKGFKMLLHTICNQNIQTSTYYTYTKLSTLAANPSLCYVQDHSPGI